MPHLHASCSTTSSVATRGVSRKLGQGETGYVPTTHTMSGVYRLWDCQKRNPLETQWKTTPKAKEAPDTTRRVVPGASNGQARRYILAQVWSVGLSVLEPFFSSQLRMRPSAACCLINDLVEGRVCKLLVKCAGSCFVQQGCSHRGALCIFDP